MSETTEQNLPMRPMQAAGLMVMAMAIIGFIDNYIVVIAEYIGLWQFYLVRGVMAMGLVIMMSRMGMGRLRARRIKAVVIRSLLVSIALLLYFGALAFMPLAQALAGLFTSPVFVLLITALGLRKPIGPWRILAVAIGFAGILLVLNPDAGQLNLLMLMPVAGGLFYALGAVATRTLCEGESTMCLLFGLTLCQVAIGAIAVFGLWVLVPDVPDGRAGFLVRGWVWPVLNVFPWIILQAVGSVIGVALIIRSYQTGEASQVAVLEYSALVFGPFFAWVLIGQGVSVWQAVGIAMIAGAGVIIALRSR